MGDSRERVGLERRLRGWSVREAARHGGVSNTLWGKWEQGAASAQMIPAVAQAFGWPADWESNPPPVTMPPPDDLASRVAELERAVLLLLEEARSRGALDVPAPPSVATRAARKGT